ncbi:MAG: CHAD domain-containing protein [Candidatus Eremiobacteraeota bacterium]|nr:CHAD domain-containing protein [Candidatus Eremiobacteraeota bacterium]
MTWATMLVRQRMSDLQKVQRKAKKHWCGGKYVHKLRTHARRLRAAIEDLRGCIPNAQKLIDESKNLGQKTGKIRDADVLIRRLQRYRVFAFAAERAEIDALCKPLEKQRKAARKPAKACVRDFHVKLSS